MEVFLRWQNLLRAASKLTNVKIVTKDRKEKHTHKLFLVAISETFRNLLIDHMEAENTVIILPDDTLEEVEIELEQLLLASNDHYSVKPFKSKTSYSNSSKDFQCQVLIAEETMDNYDADEFSNAEQAIQQSNNKDTVLSVNDYAPSDNEGFKTEECSDNESTLSVSKHVLDDEDGNVYSLKIKTKEAGSKRKNLTIVGSKQSKKKKYEEAAQAYYRFGFISTNHN